MAPSTSHKIPSPMPQTKLKTVVRFMYDTLDVNKNLGIGLEYVEATHFVCYMFTLYNLHHKAAIEFFVHVLQPLGARSTLLQTAGLLRLSILAESCTAARSLHTTIPLPLFDQNFFSNYFFPRKNKEFMDGIHPRKLCMLDAPDFLMYNADRFRKGYGTDRLPGWFYEAAGSSKKLGQESSWLFTFENTVLGPRGKKCKGIIVAQNDSSYLWEKEEGGAWMVKNDTIDMDCILSGHQLWRQFEKAFDTK